MSTSVDSSVVARWRLILGQSAEEQLTVSSGNTSIHLSEDELIMDQALAAIYDETSEIGNSGTANTAASGQRGAGSGKSAPRLAKWLGDVRNFSLRISSRLFNMMQWNGRAGSSYCLNRKFLQQ